ncbi:MAG: gamma-glutamyl-gamma-aminobutyrate hydrolase family protein [Rubrobacteraceae bacterium]|nr:gamma-glutamyl-gamma-aminobutyrate hydrolase family protein [Rubrobacteraceae bacterium]
MRGSGRRPTIGVTAATESVSYGAWSAVPAVVSPASYVRAVQRAGGRPVLLLPDPEDAEDPAGVLDIIDALIVTGGGDVDSSLYGQEPHPETSSVREERDAYELALVRAAIGRGMPTLGICRGMQVLNIAYGGGIEQHLPDVVGHEDHRHTPGAFADHEVDLETGSLAARAVGAERAPVKSHHHQGVREIGEGLVVTGRSDDDTVEALEDPSCPFVLGVLWHPEEDEKSQLIKALVSEVF